MRSSYHGLTIRGDALSCPLAFGLDTYYGCPYDCVHCTFLGLNAVWGHGEDRALDLGWLVDMLDRGLRNEHPRSALACAIRGRKTVRVGNKYDPFPPYEDKLGIARAAIEVLLERGFQVKVETKAVDRMLGAVTERWTPDSAIITTTIHVGLDEDWDRLEGRRVPSPARRLEVLRDFALEGYQVGVSAEPFLAGHHTVEQYGRYLDTLLEYGVHRTNVYNLRLNAFVAKRLAGAGYDIERIWAENEDGCWRVTLGHLIEAAEERGMILGCPDFVNAGRSQTRSNTCCGVDVARPCTFNWHTWRRIGIESGLVTVEDLRLSYDGVGDLGVGLVQFLEGSQDFYTLDDTGVFTQEWSGWRLN